MAKVKINSSGLVAVSNEFMRVINAPTIGLTKVKIGEGNYTKNQLIDTYNTGSISSMPVQVSKFVTRPAYTIFTTGNDGIIQGRPLSFAILSGVKPLQIFVADKFDNNGVETYNIIFTLDIDMNPIGNNSMNLIDEINILLKGDGDI